MARSTPSFDSVSITVATPGEAERAFVALSGQGTVTMPFAATFWSAGVGMLIDRFGIPWMVNTARGA